MRAEWMQEAESWTFIASDGEVMASTRISFTIMGGGEISWRTVTKVLNPNKREWVGRFDDFHTGNGFDEIRTLSESRCVAALTEMVQAIDSAKAIIERNRRERAAIIAKVNESLGLVRAPK